MSSIILHKYTPYTVGVRKFDRATNLLSLPRAIPVVLQQLRCSLKLSSSLDPIPLCIFLLYLMHFLLRVLQYGTIIMYVVVCFTSFHTTNCLLQLISFFLQFSFLFYTPPLHPITPFIQRADHNHSCSTLYPNQNLYLSLTFLAFLSFTFRTLTDFTIHNVRYIPFSSYSIFFPPHALFNLHLNNSSPILAASFFTGNFNCTIILEQ